MPERNMSVQNDLAGLKSDMAGLKADLASEVAGLKADIADVKAETRVTKHDVVNLRDMFAGLGHRLDKLEDKIIGKIETINMTQARGLGFFAGVSAVVTIAGGFMLALAKMLFGHGP